MSSVFLRSSAQRWPGNPPVFASVPARQRPPLPEAVTAHAFRRTFITLMLEARAPVPYVRAQVDHDNPTTLHIYKQVLRRRDRRRHGEAFDALMTVPFQHR